jgi:predicted transcriptional regulator of viral defense system
VQTLTNQLLELGLANRFLTDNQLTRLIDGSPQRRYHLVNRAMKAQELIRLRRGLYTLSGKYRDKPCHPYAVAQAMTPGSYVSFETALSYHGWIPEAVYTTASVVSNRKSTQHNHETMGKFTFHPLAIHKGHFLELVEHTRLGDQSVLMAMPARALMDLVCLRKIDWQGLAWIEDGLRIEPESLSNIDNEQIQTLKTVYKQQRVQHFLSQLALALDLDIDA